MRFHQYIELWPLFIALAGLVGFAADRASLCTVKAVREIFNAGTAHMLVGFAKTVLWVVGITILLAWGIDDVEMNPPGFAILPSGLLGGVIFGVGAVFNRGCSLSTLTRLGRGDLGMTVTLAGFTMAVTIYELIQRSTSLLTYTRAAPGLNLNDGLARLLGISLSFWMLWEGLRLWRTAPKTHWRKRLLASRYRLSTAAAVMGVSNGILFALVGTWSYTHTLHHGIVQLINLDSLEGDHPLILLWWLFIALVIGVFVSAFLSGRFDLVWRPRWSWLGYFSGGGLMGFGARLVPGGNDVLLLNAIPGFSPHALPAYVAMLVGIAITLNILKRVGSEYRWSTTAGMCAKNSTRRYEREHGKTLLEAEVGMVYRHDSKSHTCSVSETACFKMSARRPLYSRFIFILSFVLVISMTWSHAMAVEGALNVPGGRIRSNCATPFGLIEAEASTDRKRAVLEEVWLPEGQLFRPLLADMKQPRFYASYRRVHFGERGLVSERRGESIFAGIVGFGTDFGLWALRQPNGCDGIQVDLSSAVFSQFNLNTPSNDLINTDFFVGPSLTLRRGYLSGRLRLFHQSSHLGDEFLLNNPGVDRIGLSFEAIDLLLSVERRMWRLYAGGGYLFHIEPDLEKGTLKWGLELYALPWLRQTKKMRWMPVFGANFNALEEQKWKTTTSIKGGIEVANLSGTRHFRFLIVYLKGFMPFGQFFNTARIENYGIELQFSP